MVAAVRWSCEMDVFDNNEIGGCRTTHRLRGFLQCFSVWPHIPAWHASWVMYDFPQHLWRWGAMPKARMPSRKHRVPAPPLGQCA